MIQHYIDCAVCGTILSIVDNTKRAADGTTYPLTDVILDLTTERDGRPIPIRGKISFVGDKMRGRVLRFRAGDTVEIAFTPKCKERFRDGHVTYYSYNLGFRIYMARDEGCILQPQQFVQ